MFEILRKTNINFVEKRKYTFILSGIVVLIGIFSFVQMIRGKANLGIDFAGGTSVQLKFEMPVKISNARKIMEKNGFSDAELQEITDGNKLLIRVKKLTAIKEEVASKIIEVFTMELPENKFIVESTTEIGPSIGKKLRKDATIAVIISIIGIITYIAFRFEFRFGIIAAIATFHDVLAVMGILYILNKEFNILIITALLTIAGYSLTDTVVIFDRIRENLKKLQKKSLTEIVNNSLNQTLSRTIITSLTTLLVLLAFFFVGGEVLHDFSFALLLGVIVGTYSSVFLASPILIEWKGYTDKRYKKR